MQEISSEWVEAMEKFKSGWEGRKLCPNLYWKESEGGVMQKISTDQDGRKPRRKI